LREAESRVAAISQIHAMLHQSGPGEVVEMGAYFELLAVKLRATAPTRIRIETEVVGQAVPSARATSLALIANEFAANSLKHAFADGVDGVIRLMLLPEGDEIVARFSDDGCGGGRVEGKGLGGLIMQVAAEQLGSALTCLDGPGTALELRFARNG
jgi:two-component sensor histidine kinase